MAGLCEGGNEPPGSLKASKPTSRQLASHPHAEAEVDDHPIRLERNPVANTSYNGWGDHRANHTIPPFWLDDRPPLLRHVGVRPAAGWSV
ncbi:hypothetical protein ANN_21894 [Periplaneta americana]|uniref:Uncharacterized protein n=1 Tax=Periplaneta americana TaxID=6978 RepID=A0ABQ8S6W6_PERAM|nr:hypothetical protein ANN_21894 [Periplaneta americana]